MPGVKSAQLGADILFCDDNSPDGTGDIVDELAREFSHVRVIHRSGKLGIGSAHQEGIRYAYAHGYETLVTMDCDFTHRPCRRPTFVGGRAFQRPARVHCVALHEARQPARLEPDATFPHIPGPFPDRQPSPPATGRDRGAARLPTWRYSSGSFRSSARLGYSFFFESLFVLHRNGFAIEEMPIALPARTYGSSKMSLRETVRSALRLLQLYWAGVRHPESFLLTAPLRPILGAELPLQDPQGWDPYWTRGQEKSRRAYSFVASLYRRLAIRRNLNHFIHKHFVPGAQLLHAGCGSGQVDSELSREMRITAVDISLPALESYRRNNPGAEAIRRGDILHLDEVAGGSFDGAYNLGVVEHFTQDEIVQILREMGRTVKPGGKVVIFWPHRCATSVFVLRLIHRVLDFFHGRAKQ